MPDLPVARLTCLVSSRNSVRREGKGSEFGTGGEATMTSSKSGQATALSTHRQYN